ncbi:MAG: phosphatidylinositol-specific phospholipase C domain-containing protein [Bacteroidia bacterium]
MNHFSDFCLKLSIAGFAALYGNIAIAQTISGNATSPARYYGNSDWMARLPDTISIADINIPGSHDAVAINRRHMTHYACQNISITEQLDSGIRMLDIRIKVKGHSPDYKFVTCHGNIFGGLLKFNEYQSLSSVFDECRDFLNKNTGEFIVMTLKIDDWNKKDKENMYAALHDLLSKYPVYNTTDASLPALGKVRGKIYLLSRIDTATNEFGAPVAFPINTCGLVAGNSLRSYPVYIQDHYKDLTSQPENTKFDLVEKTFHVKKKEDNMVVLNFASAIDGFMNLSKVYLQGKMLSYFGSMDGATRPANLGWIMLNYGFWKFKTDKYNDLDIVKLIISSNFQYKEYPEKFELLSPQHIQN